MYGFLVQRTIKGAGREVSVESVYAALGRLELKGLVASRPGESASVRAGRAKRYFRVTGLGLGSVRETRRILGELWGLPYFERSLHETDQVSKAGRVDIEAYIFWTEEATG